MAGATSRRDWIGCSAETAGGVPSGGGSGGSLYFGGRDLRQGWRAKARGWLVAKRTAWEAMEAAAALCRRCNAPVPDTSVNRVEYLIARAIVDHGESEQVLL